MLDHVFVLGFDSSEEIEHWFISIALVLGIIKCFFVAKRPKTSAVCILSLMLPLIAFFLFSVYQVAANSGIHTIVPAQLVKGILGFCFFALIFLSLILGIIGLAQWFGNRDRYNQGIKQAIWGIGISSIVMVLGFIGIATEIAKNNIANASRLVSTVRSDKHNNRFDKLDNRVGEHEKFDTFNFRFEHPNKPWVKIDISRFNQHATTGYLRSRPGIFFIVIAERFDEDLGISNEALVEISKGNLKSSGSDVVFGSSVEETINNVKGVRFIAEASMGKKRRFAYSTWVASHNGFIYQLITHGNVNDADVVRREAMQICKHFHLIDYNCVAFSKEIEAIEKVESIDFGYSINLTNRGWRMWLNRDKDFPGSHFGGLHRLGAAISVVPLRLDFSPPDDQALIAAMLQLLDFNYLNDPIASVKPIQQSGIKGYALETSREIDGEKFLYRLRILKGEKIAYLLASWIDATQRDSINIIEEALDLVTISQQIPTQAKMKLNKAQRRSRALVINDLGVTSQNNSQYEKAIEYHKIAFNEFADDAVMLGNLLRAYSALGRFQEALDFLEPRIDSFPDNLQIGSWHAFLSMKAGQEEKASKIYARLFDLGFDSEDDLRDYVHLLIDTEKYDVAIEVLKAFLQRKPSRRATRWLATVFSRKGECDAAVKLLQELQEGRPFDSQIAYSLIDVYDDAERYRDSIAVCEQLVDNGFDIDQTHFLRGRNEFSLKWYRQAKESFEKAIKLNPHHHEAIHYIDIVSGLLGEGKNSSIKSPIDPVVIPPQVQKAIEVSQTSHKLSSDVHDSYYDLRMTGVYYKQNDVFRTTYYRRATALSVASVRRMSSLEFSFNPLSEKIFVNRLVVRNTEKEIVAEGSVNHYYVTDKNDGQIASQEKTLHIPVPGLKVGYSIECIVTRENLASPKTFPHTEHLFSSTSTIRSSIFFVSGDLKELKYHVSGVGSPIKFDDVMYWLQNHPSVYRLEVLQPPYYDFMPMVWVSDGTVHWDTAAREYLEKIHDKLVLDQGTRQLAMELTKKLDSPIEKIEALARYVQNDYTYKAIEFGHRARIPNTAAHTIRNKYGDCKDHSVLLHQLLRAIGIRSHLALVGSFEPFQMDLPSLDQFDHMILCVRDSQKVDGASRFIDCTDKNANVMLNPPSHLASRFALILDAKNPKVERIPPCSSGNSFIKVHRRVTLVTEPSSKQIDVVVDEDVTLSGCYGSSMRGYLRNVESEKRRSLIQQLLMLNGNYRLQEISSENIPNPSLPVLLKLRYTMKKAFQADGNRLTGKLAMPWERYYTEPTYLEQRHTPFEFTDTVDINSTTTFMLPKRFQPMSLDLFSQQDRSKYQDWSMRSVLNNNQVKFLFRFTRPSGKYEASKYSEYYNVTERMVETLNKKLILTQLNQ